MQADNLLGDILDEDDDLGETTPGFKRAKRGADEMGGAGGDSTAVGVGGGGGAPGEESSTAGKREHSECVSTLAGSAGCLGAHTAGWRRRTDGS